MTGRRLPLPNPPLLLTSDIELHADDLTTELYTVWRALRAAPYRRRLELADTPGRIVNRSLTAVIKDLWPTLSDGAAESSAQAARVQLLHRGNLRDHHGRLWVADAWDTPAPAGGHSDTPTTERQRPDRPRQASTATYPCSQCPFVAVSRHALKNHAYAFRGKPHPTDRFPCHICPAVFTARGQLNRHLHDRHPSPRIAQAPAAPAGPPDRPASMAEAQPSAELATVAEMAADTGQHSALAELQRLLAENAELRRSRDDAGRRALRLLAAGLQQIEAGRQKIAAALQDLTPGREPPPDQKAQ